MTTREEILDENRKLEREIGGLDSDLRSQTIDVNERISIRNQITAKQNTITANKETLNLYLRSQQGQATTQDVTERIGALEVNVNDTRTELNTTRTELEATRTRINTQLSLSQDTRLFYFSTAMPRSRGSHSTASRQVRSLYGPQCLFCGSNKDVTLAHLVAGHPCVDYSAFGPPKYHPDFDYKSVRNFILLCGTRGQEGTCHNEFDNCLICMVPAPLEEAGNRYTLLCLRPDFAKYEELNNKTILVCEPSPYRRLLAWRNRKCLLEHGRLCSDGVIQNALRACDLSEIANSVNNSDSDSDGDVDSDNNADGDDVDVDNFGGDNVDADEVDFDNANSVPIISVK